MYSPHLLPRERDKMIEVICAHPFKESREGNDCYIYDCLTCKAHWYSEQEEPEIVIGYVKESRSGEAKP